MYRLRVNRLREIAAQHGDTSPAAIARRTGIAESSVYRILSGASQPDLNSALRLANAYEITVEELMEPMAVEAERVPA
ncbi:helix-turn-helix domain-containing protein [Streptomyces sp. SID5594]|uniref:helix-turn-helix domain-containing protein n=1 Tax=unclassified Streptomyces TaxID=2593676 RepID=UPI000376F947|nr:MULTISPECIES: helix-turn-helix transcriptional regulator [unclassified Streptomyces]MZF56885.1 helix-turn-helix domain-containing protein [Streptomyces sp. SID5594]